MPQFGLVELSRSLDTLAGDHRRQLERFTAQAAFARKLSKLHPAEQAGWEALVEQAADRVRTELEAGRVDALEAAVKEAEGILAPIGEVAKQYTVHCIGHSHIDMNWMWSWPETVSLTNDTFLTVDRLMDAYPEFCYTQSQASVYALTEEYHPQLFDRIKQRVGEGRWEVAASMWVEGDKNLAGGESLCRHLLYTRQYVKERFGLAPEDVKIGWEPDTFGHAHTVPSFLARAGVTRYYLSRGGEEPRPPVYWWQAPDGSRVLVVQQNLDWPITVGIGLRSVDFAERTGLKDSVCVYGVGDHGGGPTRKDLERALEMDRWPVFPNIRLTRADRYFETLEQYGDRLPVLDGELNFVFEGCYTSESNIKRANRFAEAGLYEAEAAACAAWALGLRDYPTDTLRESWIRTLFCQFHDILPGSGVRATYEHAQGLFQETAAEMGMVQTQSLRAISASVDTSSLVPEPPATASKGVGPALGAGVGEGSWFGGVSSSDGGADAHRPFVVFNPNAWARNEVVSATLWNIHFDPERVIARVEEGDTFSTQVVERGHYWGHDFVRVAFPAKEVPALGYRTYLLFEGDAEPLQGGSVTRAEPNTLENDLIRIHADPVTGGISMLLDKRNGANLAADDDPLAGLEYAVEQPHSMTAWTIGDISRSTRPLPAARFDRGKVGPYLGTLASTYRINDSLVSLQTTVKAGDPCVGVTIKATWVERGSPDTGVPMLRAHFPLGLQDRTVRYEIPYGHIVRDLPGGQEVPSQRWADVSGRTNDGKLAGLVLLNNTKYGHSMLDNAMRLTLIRSSYDPDILPEIGEQEIRLGLLPHGADWGPADCIRSGAAFNHPLKVIGTDIHSGDLPPNLGFLSIDTPNVILGALKKAEQEDALILRFYEVDGVDTAVTVDIHSSLADGFAKAREVDLLERPWGTNTARLTNGKLTVTVPARGITSVELRKA